MSRATIFTIVRDEPFFLPLWLRYYTAQFGEDNCYIFSDDSREACNFRRITDVAQAKQRELLQSYDVVVHADADEFFVTRSGKPFIDFCHDFAADTDRHRERAVGYNVIHQIDDEPALDAASSGLVLQHRSKMQPHGRYDKPTVTKEPLTYYTGFHWQTSDEGIGSRRCTYRSADLVLLHLQKVDFDLYCARSTFNHALNLAQGWKPHGSPDRGANALEFRSASPLIEIPARWKTLF